MSKKLPTCVLILPLIFWLFGCATPRSGGWVKDDASKDDLLKDYEECRGPTGFVYAKEGVTKEEYQGDLASCGEEAEVRGKHVNTAEKVLTYTGWLPFIGVAISAANLIVTISNSADYTARCMERKDYKVVSQKDRKVDANEIKACMEEKRYEWK